MKQLKPKRIKPRIKLLKAVLYKSNMVYVRMIDTDIFEWAVIFKGELYSSYMVISPRKGKTKLSEAEIAQASALLFAGALATIDTLLDEKLEEKDLELVNKFESLREVVTNEKE